MSNRKTNNFRSCATCQIRVCDKNRNKNEDSSRPMIEKNIINEIFKRKAPGNGGFVPQGFNILY